jgi:CDP-diglyceride synthetase
MLCYVAVHHLNFVTINETFKLILAFYKSIKMLVHFNIIVMNATFKVILTLCSSILVVYGDSFAYGANEPTL